MKTAKIDAPILHAIFLDVLERLAEMGSSEILIDLEMPISQFVKDTTGRDALGADYGNVREVWQGLEPAHIEKEHSTEDELIEEVGEFTKRIIRKILEKGDPQND